MKLWLIQPIETRPNKGIRGTDPWEPWYDTAQGFVVRAATEYDARRFADAGGGDETRSDTHYSGTPRHPWLDPAQSSCVELTDAGDPETILRDFAAA